VSESQPHPTATGNKERTGTLMKVGLAVITAVALVAGSSAATLAITLTTASAISPAAAARPVANRDLIPDDLRDDLLAVREAPQADRPEMIADIRDAGTVGDYGPAVQRLLEGIDEATAEQTPELQAEIDQIRAETDPDARRELVRLLREDLDAGVYGTEAQDRVEDLRTAFREDGARGLIRELRAGR
jgi:hypothetical protein